MTEGIAIEFLELGPGDGLRYRHEPPSAPEGVTFVMVNALSGDLGMWDAEVGPRLRAAGHGTLLWNLRGQEGSPAAPGTALDDACMAGDLARLLEALRPRRPVAVGLSIGGLFAAHARLRGAELAGLVLINTLRRPGARLAWINDAVLRAADVGGLEMLRDLFAPLLFSEGWLERNRHAFLADAPYRPLDPASGARRLLADSRGADWDVEWERIEEPVLVVTGLQDRVFRDPADVDALAARLPRPVRLDLPDAGHMVPVEQPARLAEALLGFAAAL